MSDKCNVRHILHKIKLPLFCQKSEMLQLVQFKRHVASRTIPPCIVLKELVTYFCLVNHFIYVLTKTVCDLTVNECSINIRSVELCFIKRIDTKDHKLLCLFCKQVYRRDWYICLCDGQMNKLTPLSILLTIVYKVV